MQSNVVVGHGGSVSRTPIAGGPGRDPDAYSSRTSWATANAEFAAGTPQ